MFEKKVSEINQRLEKYKSLGTIGGRNGFIRKIKDVYASFLFFMVKPLVHQQNAYNQALFDFNRQSSLHLEQIDQQLEELAQKLNQVYRSLKQLEYKTQVKFPPDFDYSQFEDQFRGPEGLVAERQKVYLDYLNQKLETLDIGCGRGEFLQLLQGQGFKARGIDSDKQMVERCRQKGLEVEQAEAVSYIERYPGKLGNIFLSQIVEHMDYKDIYKVIKTCWEKMEPEAVILIETINPNSFYAQSRAYVIDPTHVSLVSPETISYTYQKVGFRNLKLIYKSPVPQEQRLSLIEEKTGDKKIDGIISDLNKDLAKIDDIMFGNLEYAIMGVK